MVNIKNQVSIRLPEDLKNKIEIKAKSSNRNFTNQVEDYLRIALIAEENPDLPFEFIKDILEAKAEKEAGLGKPFSLD